MCHNKKKEERKTPMIETYSLEKVMGGLSLETTDIALV